MFSRKEKLICTFLLAFIFPSILHAANFTVNTTQDTHDATPGNGICADGSGNCSLRAAIEESNALAGSDNITLPANSTSYILTLNTALTVTESLTIQGDQASTTVIDFNNANPPFTISGGATNFSLTNLKLTGGNTADGAIIKHSGNVLTLTHVYASNNVGLLMSITGGSFVFDSSVFSQNSSIESISVLLTTATGTISNSIFFSNSAAMAPAVISTSANLTFNNSEIVNNNPSTSGTGVRSIAGLVSFQNSILSNNNGTNCTSFGGTFSSLGNNIEDQNDCSFGVSERNINPLLGSLDSTSFSLPFYPLQATSPARDTGSACVSTDIRGISRPQPSGGACDIGAFEGRRATADASLSSLTFSAQRSQTSSAAQTVTISNNGDFTLTISDISISGDYAQTNTCAGSIAAGASCSLSITFTPTTTGSRSGALTVSHNGASSPLTITLLGTGAILSEGTEYQGDSFFGNCALNLALKDRFNLVFIVVCMLPLLLFQFFRKKRLFFLVLLVFSSSSWALTPSASNELFKPALDDSDYFTLSSSPVLKTKHYHLGGYFDYFHNPIKIGGVSSFSKLSDFNKDIVVGHFLGSYGVWKKLSVGASLPVYLSNSFVSLSTSENHLDLGDVLVNIKYNLLDRKKSKLGLSLLGEILFPTATHASSHYTGEGSFGGGGKIILDSQVHSRVNLALNAGAIIREKFTNIDGNEYGSRLNLGLGVAVDLIPKKLKLIAEDYVETQFSDFFKRTTTPMEARLGLRYRFKNGLNLNLGGGLGYLDGFASPQYRLFAGATYTKGRVDEFTLAEAPVDEYSLQEKEWSELVLGDEFKLKDKIFFNYDEAQLRGISKSTLDQLALFLKNHPEFNLLRIEGHTCDLGAKEYNLKLSQKRADEVKAYLVGQGVENSRLQTVGKGMEFPIVQNTDEEHREQNRRVSIFVAEKKLDLKNKAINKKNK